VEEAMAAMTKIAEAAPTLSSVCFASSSLTAIQIFEIPSRVAA